MKVIIIDDEQMAIDVLEILLNQIKGIEIVGKYTDPQMVLVDLPKLNADVAFIDMEMGNMHGLELAEMIQSTSPKYLEIVFVTAYPQFALEAFEVNAIDYLLKPVHQERLSQTMAKLDRRLGIYQKKQQQANQGKKDIFMQVMGSCHLFDANGHEVKWRTKKVKELFVLLWQQKEIGIHRSELIVQLWPEITEDKATTHMHTTVYQLRKAIRNIGYEQPVILRNGRYILNIQVNSDLDQLDIHFTSANKNAAIIENILKLYRGSYLEMEDYEWAFLKQEEIKNQLLDCLEKFVINHKPLASQRKLLEICLKKMIELDPYNEQYAYLFLDFYGKTKELPKMIALFQDIKEKWIEELGVDIPKEIHDLYVKYIA